jgi:sterol desaturase/sphingolipid hydroxylase (fatty acid hydroxylase superfamily)
MIQTLTQNVPGFVVDLVRLCIWLAILTAIFVPLERLFALHPAKIWRKEIAADLGYYFLGGMVVSLFLSLPLGAVAWAVHRFVPNPLQTAFSGTPFWPKAFLALTVAEIGYYWGHRLQHQVPFLWRFHAIHHSPGHIDFLVNSRAHPVDLVFGRFCAFIPLYVLGLAQPTAAGALTPILVTLGTTVWGYFIHANVRWRFGPLEWLIATPGFHHWHHAMAPANRNYASTLPVLDRMFGTLHMPKGQWPPAYGIQGLVPESWSDQLVLPLVGSFPLDRPAEHLVSAQPPLEVSS